jgi:hypothetical protein
MKFKIGTQKQILHDYLQTGKVITTKTAINELGIADVQGCIRDLKKAGVNIQTINRKVNTRYTKADGSPKYAYIKEYKLGIDDSEIWTFRTAEEQAEWESFCESTPIEEDTLNILKSKHQWTQQGAKINEEVDINRFQDRLDESC